MKNHCRLAVSRDGEQWVKDYPEVKIPAELFEQAVQEFDAYLDGCDNWSELDLYDDNEEEQAIRVWNCLEEIVSKMRKTKKTKEWLEQIEPYLE